jgi:hypothetical protein
MLLCKTWRARAIGHDGKQIVSVDIIAPNKILAKLNLAHEYPKLMARADISSFKISVKRG